MYRNSILLLLIAILILPACAQATPTPISTPPASNLVNSSWVLSSYGSEGGPTAVVAGSQSTLQFHANGQVAGSGGCNSFGGKFTLEGGKLTFQDITSTLMACADTNLMDQESAFFHALNSATRFEMSRDMLKIFYDGGVLNFTKAG